MTDQEFSALAASRIVVREIAERGITVTADATGTVYVNDIATTTPITAQGLTFVWAPDSVIPGGVKISLPAAALALIDKHSAEFRAAVAAQTARARKYNALFNEGGEGFNPYS